MTPIRVDTVVKKLDKLKDMVRRLKKIQGEYQTKKAFLGAEHIEPVTERYLMIGIESIIDIGNHILSELFQEHPDDYADTIRRLAKCGVLPQKFIAEQEGMAGFRNILVHEYANIDVDQVYANLQNAPEVFSKFASHYLVFLEKHDFEPKRHGEAVRRKKRKR